jgi:hypothetical protein
MQRRGMKGRGTWRMRCRLGLRRRSARVLIETRNGRKRGDELGGV